MAAKRSISALPYFVCASSLIAFWPFRYLWNNPPRFVGNNVWLAIFTAFTADLIVATVLTYVMMFCWSRWKSNR